MNPAVNCAVKADRAIRCPICQRGRLLNAAEHTDLRSLRLFRPEQAQTVPTEQAEKYDADVTAVQFLGSSYQLQLNHNGQDWTYISPRRVSVGEKISLYLPRSAIVAV